MRLNRRNFLRLVAAGVALGTGWRWLRPLPAPAAADAPGIVGRVINIATDRPLAGAVVQVIPDGPSALTDETGMYRLSLPPGQYDVRVAPDGYIGANALGCQVDVNTPAPVDFKMIPANLSPEQEAVVYERVVKVPEFEPPAVHAAGGLVGAAISIPASIRVLRTATGAVTTMSLEDQYLPGVVPSEMPASWHSEALRAQAVAARCYAVNAIRGGGRHPNADVCDGPHCQAWKNETYDTTNEAVQATRGVVALYNGAVIDAMYFTACNGHNTLDSENAIDSETCRPLNWNYVPYLRSRACGGHIPCGWSHVVCPPCGFRGHGLGLCQHGAQAKAIAEKSYQDIIHEYYTNVTIAVGTPALMAPLPGQTLLAGLTTRFQWSDVGANHLVQVWQDSTGWSANSGWIAGGSWEVMLPSTVGVYRWRVQARTGGLYSEWSETRQFTVAAVKSRNYLPIVGRNAAG